MRRSGSITPILVRTGWVLVLVVGFALSAAAWEPWNSGKAVWGTDTLSGSEQLRIGMRYLPEFSLETRLSETVEVSFETMLELHRFGTLRSGVNKSTEDGIDPYRLSLRVAASQYETQAGLLRDYYSLNNANIRAWISYASDYGKGWEILSSDDREVALSDPMQLPVPADELKPSSRHLGDDPESQYRTVLLPRQGKFKEQRISLDHPFTAGNWAHLFFEQVGDATAGRKVDGISTGESDCPPIFFEKLSALVRNDWDSKDRPRFLAWQRTHGSWQWRVHANAFWRSRRRALYKGNTSTTRFGGKGAQVTVVFHY